MSVNFKKEVNGQIMGSPTPRQRSIDRDDSSKTSEEMHLNSSLDYGTHNRI